MKYLFLILSTSILLSGELEVDGDLKVTGTIQSSTIDSLISLIAQLEQRIAQLECQNTGIIPDGYCNCFFHTLDECDVCNGDTTTCQDCAGVPNGDSLQDMCGYCDNDSSNDCVQDCFGEWGGTALEDLCGVCGGICDTWCGCDSICEAVEDVCGVCGGDVISEDECNLALSFDGEDDEVWIAINPPNTNYTYSFNIKTEIDNQRISRTAAITGGGGSDREIEIDDGNIKHRLWQCHEIILTDGISVSDGNWHQVTITVESGIGQKIYIDGVLSASGSCSKSDFNWEEGFEIGSQGSYFYNGQLDQLSLWNRVLGESEINSIQYVDNYLDGYESGLMGYWHFNEGNGMTLYDYSGNNYNGTIYGNPEWVQVNP